MNYFNYFSEIEEAFNRRRGKHFFLSPLDWAVVEGWQLREIPLHIVLRSIEKVFDGIEKSSKRQKRISSLVYFVDEVESQYSEWLESQVGKATESEPNTETNEIDTGAVREHLGNVCADLRTAEGVAGSDLRDVLGRVLGRLEELASKYSSTEELENSLGDLERIIDDALLKEPEAGELAAEIDSQMSAYKSKMDKDAYRKTHDLMLLKRLREVKQIPRLSLFYL